MKNIKFLVICLGFLFVGCKKHELPKPTITVFPLFEQSTAAPEVGDVAMKFLPTTLGDTCWIYQVSSATKKGIFLRDLQTEKTTRWNGEKGYTFFKAVKKPGERTVELTLPRSLEDFWSVNECRFFETRFYPALSRRAESYAWGGFSRVLRKLPNNGVLLQNLTMYPI